MEIIQFNLSELLNSNTGFALDYPLYIYSLGISYELGLGEVLKVDNWSRKKNDYSYPIVIL